MLTRGRPGVVVAAALVVLLAAVCVSLLVGRQALAPDHVLRALVLGGDADPLGVVRGLRLQRTVVALLAGGALGAAGALMQALTRNPLADPGLFGITAGAAAAVVTGFTFFGVASTLGQMWLALAGAALAAVAVHAVGARGNASSTPARLALAGAALSAVLLSYVDGVSLRDQDSFDELRFWVVGSVVNRGWDAASAALPFLACGAVAALLVAPGLNALALGDDAGRSLGLRVGRTRLLTAFAITVLAGAATAVTGPIGFVGLVVPHAVRAWTGPDQRRVVPLSMVVAAAFLLLADTAGRVVGGTGEVPAGVVTAVAGAPVFIAFVRRRRVVAL